MSDWVRMNKCVFVLDLIGNFTTSNPVQSLVIKNIWKILFIHSFFPFGRLVGRSFGLFRFVLLHFKWRNVKCEMRIHVVIQMMMMMSQKQKKDERTNEGTNTGVRVNERKK